MREPRPGALLRRQSSFCPEGLLQHVGPGPIAQAPKASELRLSSCPYIASLPAPTSP